MRLPIFRQLSAAVLAVCCLVLALPQSGAARTQRHHPHPLVVVLDPGHGGPDSGAADPGQALVEKDLTLQVALAAARDLRAMGYQVFLTRTRDQAVNIPPRDLNHDGTINEVDELDARTLFANRHHADAFVSIHFDASTDPTVRGTHGYYCPARPFWRKSRGLAGLLTAAVTTSIQHAGYADANNGVQTDVADVVPQTYANYPWFFQLGPSWPHRITGTQMPGALIETLFLTSPQDDAALRRPGIIAAAARGYAAGIRAYFGGHAHQ